MADSFTCGLELQQLTSFVLQVCALMSIYLFGRELAEIYLFRRSSDFHWSEIVLIGLPVIGILFSALGLMAVKKNIRAFLWPIMTTKVIESVCYLAILCGIPIACAVYGFDEILYEFKHRFNVVPGSTEHSTSWIVSAMIIVLISALIFPVEEVKTFQPIVAGSIFFVYVIVLVVFEMFFAVTIIRYYVRTGTVVRKHPPCFSVTKIEGTTEYQIICEGPVTPGTSPNGKSGERKPHIPLMVDQPININ